MSTNSLLYFLIVIIISVLLNFNCKNARNSPPNEKSNPSISKKSTVKKNKVIDSILLVTMNFNEKDALLKISGKISSFYHLPVKHMGSYLPKFAYYRPRNRFRADSLINYVHKLNKGKYRFVVGLTSMDISSPRGETLDWGIFGLGSLDSKGCVISSFRLKKGASNKLFVERIQKVVLHEIGHNYGLKHCDTNYPCFMKSAGGKISVVDNEPMGICINCKSKLRVRNKEM